MSFILTPSQIEIRDGVREFVSEEVESRAGQIDRGDEFPIDLWRGLTRKGLVGLQFPEKYGGRGLDYLTYILATEEASKASLALSFLYLQQGDLVAGTIARFGTEDQKQRYLSPLVKGEKIAAFALTEPNAGSDAPRAIETRAEKRGGEYLVEGRKRFISNLGHAQIILLFAKTSPQKISTFIVEAGWEGVEVGKRDKMMGIKGTEHREAILKGLRIPEENLLGREGDGGRVAAYALEGSRISVAAQGVGLAQGALDEAVKFAKERRRFGRVIGSFQAVQWMVADMETSIEAARLLTHRAAVLKDRGESYRREASEAKLFAAEVAVDSARKASQIHGGYGCVEGFKVERIYRDAKLLEIYEGTNEIHRMIIARDLLGGDLVRPWV